MYPLGLFFHDKSQTLSDLPMLLSKSKKHPIHSHPIWTSTSRQGTSQAKTGRCLWGKLYKRHGCPTKLIYIIDGSNICEPRKLAV